MAGRRLSDKSSIPMTTQVQFSTALKSYQRMEYTSIDRFELADNIKPDFRKFILE
jgi:hypothetical protein